MYGGTTGPATHEEDLTMRKLIVATIVSANGCSAGAGGDVMAMPMDHAFNNYNLERLEAAGTLLLGRTTYDGFRDFWPAVENNPSHDETNRSISRRNNAIDKVVVTDTLTEDDTDPWRLTTTIVRRKDGHAAIRALKDAGDDRGDILMFGSRTLWNDLLGAGLVDELHLMVGPVVLPEGTPAFTGSAPTLMRLLDTRRFDGSDNVLLQYAV
jgi:dihydrofolate reductase